MSESEERKDLVHMYNKLFLPRVKDFFGKLDVKITMIIYYTHSIILRIHGKKHQAY